MKIQDSHIKSEAVEPFIRLKGSKYKNMKLVIKDTQHDQVKLYNQLHELWGEKKQFFAKPQSRPYEYEAENLDEPTDSSVEQEQRILYSHFCETMEEAHFEELLSKVHEYFGSTAQLMSQDPASKTEEHEVMESNEINCKERLMKVLEAKSDSTPAMCGYTILFVAGAKQQQKSSLDSSQRSSVSVEEADLDDLARKKSKQTSTSILSSEGEELRESGEFPFELEGETVWWKEKMNRILFEPEVQ